MGMVLVQGLRSSQIKRPLFYLLLTLIGGMFSDIAWIISCSHKLFFANHSYGPVLFFIRLSWTWAIVQYQSLSLLMESLLEKTSKISPHQKCFMIISGIFCCIYLFLAIFKFNNIHPRPRFEFLFLRMTTPYAFLPVITSLFHIFFKLKSEIKIPKILRKQVKTLIQGIIAPHLILDFIQLYPFSFFQHLNEDNYVAVTLSTMFLTMALYFCARKMLGLRFLNFKNHVHTHTSLTVIDDFKVVLEQLSHASELSELKHITQSFFRTSFFIQPSRVMFYFRKLEHSSSKANELEFKLSAYEKTIELFITRHDIHQGPINEFLLDSKIVITDEIAFNDFYQSTELTKELLLFLEQINADVFIPIFEKKMMLAYIVIERDARANQFYSNIERDEMVIFAGYLANSISLLQNRNLRLIMHKDKELREELYRKHQEINQYKESIRSFLRETNHRKIGIIFYKQRHFIFGNKDAKDLLQVNLNVQDGHPLTKTISQLVHHVESYKTEQSTITKDLNNQRLVLSAVPNLDQNNIIILAYYPEIADIIKKQIDALKDPTQWDYLLYLETTQSGKLINQLIPGNGEQLLQCKIDFLKASLSKKALYLDVPHDDQLATVELLHHVSLREMLHTLTLQSPERNFDTAIRLFGINPIFGQSKEPPLLIKLNEVGTLFIENIHFLDLETQNYLAEFIRYGYFKTFKGDQKTTSDVRIICSSTMNLQTLVHEHKFSKALYQELMQTTLRMPPLHTLPKEELEDLIEGFSNQSLQTQAFKNLLEISNKERDKLLNSPISLSDLKNKVQQLLINKSKKNEIYHEVQFDPAYNITDPELIEAARLGKKALKNPKILAMLMQKFKNNQNKISLFLGVNRSSVHRRCKEYNIV